VTEDKTTRSASKQPTGELTNSTHLSSAKEIPVTPPPLSPVVVIATNVSVVELPVITLTPKKENTMSSNENGKSDPSNVMTTIFDQPFDYTTAPSSAPLKRDEEKVVLEEKHEKKTNHRNNEVDRLTSPRKSRTSRAETDTMKSSSNSKSRAKTGMRARTLSLCLWLSLRFSFTGAGDDKEKNDSNGKSSPTPNSDEKQGSDERKEKRGQTNGSSTSSPSHDNANTIDSKRIGTSGGGEVLPEAMAHSLQPSPSPELLPPTPLVQTVPSSPLSALFSPRFPPHFLLFLLLLSSFFFLFSAPFSFFLPPPSHSLLHLFFSRIL